jgi:hypothetical protein
VAVTYPLKWQKKWKKIKFFSLLDLAFPKSRSPDRELGKLRNMRNCRSVLCRLMRGWLMRGGEMRGGC